MTRTLMFIALLLSLFCGVHSTFGQSRWNDAGIALTLRAQPKGIFLDTLLKTEIEQALVIARTAKDTLQHIDACVDYDPEDLIVSTTASWADAWKNGNITTGNRYIDSLINFYGPARIRSSLPQISDYVLEFSRPLHQERLAKLFMKDTSIEWSEANHIFGGSMNIWGIKKEDGWKFIFYHGEGDCPAGCIYRYYWYVEVRGGIASLVEERSGGTNVPRRWNIPNASNPVYFASLNDMLAMIQNSGYWWERVFALQSLTLLAQQESWYTSNDLFQLLKSQLNSRKEEIYRLLLGMMNDSDADVRKAVVTALGAVSGTSPDLSAYFPLHYGNSWTWHTQGSSDIVEQIVDTVRIKGALYYKFNRDQRMDTILIRMTADNRAVSYRDSVESMLYDFNADEGTTFTVPRYFDPAGVVRLASKNDSVLFNGTMIHNCYRFENMGCMDCGWTVWFAPGLGPILRGYSTLIGGSSSSATAIRINGVNFPAAVGRNGQPMPAAYALNANYPNPFNPATQISFAIPRRNRVRVDIFDLQGKEVVTLVDEEKEAGVYALTLDGSRWTSGTYFCRLRAGSFEKTIKMLLLR